MLFEEYTSAQLEGSACETVGSIPIGLRSNQRRMRKPTCLDCEENFFLAKFARFASNDFL
jgi:hypothetical protein